MFLYYKPFLWGSFRGGSTGLKVWWFSFRSFQHLSLSLVLLLSPTIHQSLAVACPRGVRGCSRGREHFTSHQPSLRISSSFLSYSTSLASARPASVSLQHRLPSQHSWGPSGDVQHTDYTLKTSWFPYEAAGRNWGLLCTQGAKRAGTILTQVFRKARSSLLPQETEETKKKIMFSF